VAVSQPAAARQSRERDAVDEQPLAAVNDTLLDRQEGR
jgi:hypothetical protein